MTITPEAATSTGDAPSRRARLAERRRRRVRMLTGTLVIVLLLAVAGVAFFAARDEPKQATAVGRDPQIVAPGETTIPAQETPAQTLRAVSHDAPMRVWIGGDSLAGSFGPALGDLVGETGVAKTTVDYKVSSGLWAVDFRNWPQRAAEQMASADPETVIFMIGTNDTSAVNKVDSNHDGVDDWEVDYRAKLDQMMKTFVGTKHRTVYWLGPPTLGTATQDNAAVRLGEVMREEAAKYSPDVVYVDTYKLFSVKNGEYSRRILDENGKEFTARIGDGVHFSAEGGEYLARTLFKLIDTKWKLTQQADPAEPIGWTLAEGSGENVPGYSSKPQSRYGSGSSSGNNSGNNSSNNTYTPPTDPPATVPATDPPQTTPATDPPRTTPTVPTHTNPPTPTT